MTCKKCEKQLRGDEKFCTNCGSEVMDSEAVVKRAVKKDSPSVSLKGMGGWLYFVALGLLSSALLLVLAIFEVLDAFEFVTDESVRTVLTMEVAANSLLLVLLMIVIYMFTKTKKNFSHWFAIYTIASIIVLIIDNEVANSIFIFTPAENEDTYIEIFKSIVAGSIWIPYVYVSKRVKNTFIH